MASGNFAIILSLMQRVMGFPLTLKKIDFDVSFDINGRLRQKCKDVMYMIITLPEAKSFLILSCPKFCFRKRKFVQNFFFDHNVRYGNSVTFRIGVVLEASQYLDNHAPQRYDFCIECKPTDLTCR